MEQLKYRLKILFAMLRSYQAGIVIMDKNKKSHVYAWGKLDRDAQLELISLLNELTIALKDRYNDETEDLST